MRLIALTLPVVRPVVQPVVLLVVLLSACSTGPPPRYATGRDAEITIDGLRRLTRGYFTGAWVRPGAPFSDYRVIWTGYEGIIPRAEPGGTPAFAQRSNYPMPPALNETLMRHLASIFDGAIEASDTWQVGRSGGPGVAVARVRLADLVLRVPLRYQGGDDLLAADRVGAFTIVVEIFDAESGTILARAVERRSIETESHRPIRATAGPTIYESRRIFQDWAGKLIALLEDMRRADLAGAQAE